MARSSSLARAVKAPMPPASRDEWLPFHRPSLDARDIEGVVETLRSGWLTTGPVTRRFEQKFARAVGRATRSRSARAPPRSIWRSACSACSPATT
jgi:hypothetical protein